MQAPGTYRFVFPGRRSDVAPLELNLELQPRHRAIAVRATWLPRVSVHSPSISMIDGGIDRSTGGGRGRKGDCRSFEDTLAFFSLPLGRKALRNDGGRVSLHGRTSIIAFAITGEVSSSGGCTRETPEE